MQAKNNFSSGVIFNINYLVEPNNCINTHTHTHTHTSPNHFPKLYVRAREILCTSHKQRSSHKFSLFAFMCLLGKCSKGK